MSMPLVNYSDSDDDSIPPSDEPLHLPNVNVNGKRKRVSDDHGPHVKRPAPALPGEFRTLYATNVRNSTTDDPELHGGRQRQVSHMPGNWPSFVYVDWSPTEDASLCLTEIVEEASSQISSQSDAQVQSSLRSDVGVRSPLHISLSSPLTLHTDNKDRFEQQVSTAVQALRLGSFTIRLAGIRWVANFEATRSFLIATVSEQGCEGLDSLLSACNSVADQFDLPGLYTEPGSSYRVGVKEEADQPAGDKAVSDPRDKFHFSIAWTLSKLVPGTVSISKELSQRLNKIDIKVDEVLVKIGNKVTAIAL